MTGPLFAVDDVADGESARFTVTLDGRPTQVMAIRRGDAVHVYVNSCPHIGAPLDMRAGRFLNAEKSHILCANHGALFRIEDGACVHGPCAGESLQAVAVAVRHGRVYAE